MQVRIGQSPPVASKLTTIELRLTDPQGIPIEQAQVIPSAWMTNMNMETKQMRVMPLGRGNYTTELQLSMAGPRGGGLRGPSARFSDIPHTPLVHGQPTTNNPPAQHPF